MGQNIVSIIVNKRNLPGIKWMCFLFISFLAIVSADGQKKNEGIKTVVIDAGHGGKDPGTIVGQAREKNIVLDIALKLGKYVQQNHKNIKIVFTRDNDYYVPLMDRAQIANKINADLFISIHANYCENPTINGTETYVLGLHRTVDNLNVAKKENSVILLEDDYSQRYEGFNPNLSESYIMFELIQDTYLDQSLRFATILQSNFKELAQRHDRDVRQAGFLVLRETAMPSVLIETGYLSNKKENSFLLTDEGRSEIAHSIYGSLLNYLNKLDTKDILPLNNEMASKTENSGRSENITPQKQSVSKSNEKKQTEPEPSNTESGTKNKKIPAKGILKEKIETDTLGKSKEVNAIEGAISYAIQIGVFSKKISPHSKVFKGISPIRELIIEGKYKYYCGLSDNFQTTKNDYFEVSKKFPDAFIVSIQNNIVKMVWNNSSKK
jgi:N-acetylmuramoyl-L-alanine amidase